MNASISVISSLAAVTLPKSEFASIRDQAIVSSSETRETVI